MIISINIIKGNSIVAKQVITLPKEITNILKCKNPRCITSAEPGLDYVFKLMDAENKVYRCLYCETKYISK